ncbi:hypothetical protein HIM_08907 [Hirsutella minnesotensis 3608]|uniref:WSC domain-containing protein n=1 Tax=Hirsutella minnesotensis 3608 TaxID=1043627 RepID=A0A0F7ZM54_9HYPO|nr:hypothetical protein HIM_08907 [Hirsutella minnesotensis 3608]
MKSTFVYVALLATSHAYATAEIPTKVPRDEKGTLVERAGKAKQSPSAFPLPNAPTPHGCYKSAGNMTTHKVENMSSGSCNKVCTNGKFTVSGLQGSQCYCGMLYPPDSDVVEDDKCDYPCPFYDLEACGGLGKPGFWSVFNTGVSVNVDTFEPPSSSSSGGPQPSKTPTSPSSDPSDASKSAVATQSQSPSSQGDDNKSEPNTAGIVAGVVAGVVGAALVAGVFFWLFRRRRNSELQEEHRRNAAVNAFINGSKPPGSSGSMSMTDARLDPVLANRRMSDGSIADNEDYSRRILRVTNA